MNTRLVGDYRRVGHAIRGNVDRGLWAVYDAARLGLGRIRVALCPAVVFLERPHETARVSNVRSSCLAPFDKELCRCDHEGIKMKLKSKDFRVPPVEQIKLQEWPTIVKPYCKSKKRYQKAGCQVFSRTCPNGLVDTKSTQSQDTDSCCIKDQTIPSSGVEA